MPYLSTTIDSINPHEELLRESRVLKDDGLGLLTSEPEFFVTWMDPDLRPGGLRAAIVAAEDLAVLQIPEMKLQAVVIVENRETAKALPEAAGLIGICGEGMRAVELKRVPWLSQYPIIYWGDLDSYGFQILAKLRERTGFNVRSVLMDVATLEAHKELWGSEAVSTFAHECSWLTGDERITLSYLQMHGNDGFAVCLEQERIAWDYAWERIVQMADHSK
ncbi:DUF2220 domain-containing protein [Arcanobacterium hippocoleae]